MIKRVVVLGSEDSIVEEILGGGSYSAARATSAFESLLEEVEETAGTLPLREVGRRASMEAERETIERVLHRTSWNRKQAARILGVSYKTLLQKIRECGLRDS
jgi:two-component system response regulator AtoC